MKILITGGGGFIGSHLAEAHLKRGDEVWVTDTSGNHKVRHLLERGPKFHFVKESVMNPAGMEAWVLRTDLIYHLAAVVGVEHYVDDPLSVLNVNILGTLNMLQLAHRHDKRLVFSSTSEVYGRNPKVPWKETDDRVLGATNIDRWSYSTSKAAAEHYVWAFQRMGLRATVLRYFNVYGPRLDALDAGRVITVFMGKILAGLPLTIIGNGSQTRCFTYVDDAIEATMMAGLKPGAVGEVFNIGIEKETSVLQLATEMLEICGLCPPDHLRFVEQAAIYGTSYEDIGRRVPDTRRMRELLMVEPRTTLREGLTRTIRWFRGQTPPALTTAGLPDGQVG